MTYDKKQQKNEKFTDVCRLTVMCVLVSFAGWCFEKLGRWIVYHDTGDRGFLTLPLCPIYGISVVAVFLLCGTPTFLRGAIGSKIRKSRLWKKAVGNKTWRKYLFYFLFVTVLSTLAELVVGLTSKAFGLMLWDYSDRALNLFGVICASFSLLWGVLITAFMGFLWKPIYMLIRRIPVTTVRQAAFTVAVAVSVDFIVNVVIMLAG